MPTPNPRLSELLTQTAAAQRVGRGQAVISRAVKSGRLRELQGPGGIRAVWTRDLDAWAASAKPGRPPGPPTGPPGTPGPR